MVGPTIPPKKHRRIAQYLLNDASETAGGQALQHPWWQVVCLTGVDYFSTLGYQPGIAAIAAGALSPIATLILVLVTLFGALPIYKQVAKLSPHGEGSLAMLESLLPGWSGKLFVLVLLGFVSTDFIITITLSAADATTHLIQNPLMPQSLSGQMIPITLILIALLGAIFFKGFHEAMGIAVVLVVIYLSLNLVVMGAGAYQIWQQPSLIGQWQNALATGSAGSGNPVAAIGLSLLLFPKLALGLSGFETGVAVMPLVKGSPQDTPVNPVGRIRNTHRLLTASAVIMSFFLLVSSFETVVLIPAKAFQAGGAANGRALAYMAHTYLDSGFGTVYDLSTIAILWFAGASAMAGLLNIVPRYLPRYGMAPDWARATRPLVLVFGAIAFIVTLLFQADVEAQGGAYATGVLVLMSSAAFAVMLAAYKRGAKLSALAFGLITLVFFYTTLANIVERPDGIRIAACFIGFIVLTSLFSRIRRSTELRVKAVELDEVAQQFIDEAIAHSAQLTLQPTLEIIAHHRITGSDTEYQHKAKEVCEDNHLPLNTPVLFLEIEVSDASIFTNTIRVRGMRVGVHRVLRAQGVAVPNAIAAILLYLRDKTHCLPHVYFGWMEGNPFEYMARFILFGEGDVPVITREVLRKAEPNHEQRPGVHVGG
ncbi:MAG: amino acid transporter [Phormidesmis sp.]